MGDTEQPGGDTGRTFAVEYRAGRARTTDVHDWIDRWHDTAGRPQGVWVNLSDHLGLTVEQYSQWVCHPETLGDILAGLEVGDA
jgi:hypothetical protein